MLIFALFPLLLFSCLVCGKRYKNRPGLSYHYAHTHLASEEGDEAQDQETRSPPNHRNENHRREFPVVGWGSDGVGWGSDELGGQGCRVFSSPLVSLVAPTDWFQGPVVTWLF